MGASTNGTDHGLFLVGEYLGLRDQKPRTVEYPDREVTYQGCDLGLRVGSVVEAVGYPDRESATAAAAGWTIGETIRVPVVVRHGQNARGPWMLYSAADVRPATTGGFEAP